MKCLVTKLKASVNNSNLPVFSEGTLYLNKNSSGQVYYNIVDGTNKFNLRPKAGKTITYRIVSGNAHFTDAEGNGNYQTITVGRDEVFGVYVDAGNANNPKVKYSRMCDVEEVYAAKLTTSSYGDFMFGFMIADFAKQLPYLLKVDTSSVNCYLDANNDNCINKLDGIEVKMQYLYKMLSTNQQIGGDLACMPKRVVSIGGSSNTTFTYTLGKRTGNDCNPVVFGYAIAPNYISQCKFATATYFDNYLIDTAGCRKYNNLLPAIDGAEEVTTSLKAISVTINNVTYTPSADAQAAINTLVKSVADGGFGLRIYVNGNQITATE